MTTTSSQAGDFRSAVLRTGRRHYSRAAGSFNRGRDHPGTAGGFPPESASCSLLGRKINALARHDSQLSEGIAYFERFLVEEAAEAGKKVGAERGEEFRVLDLSD